MSQIPKVIHYCWFGGNPLPELAKTCIESWKRYCPDYEIVCWDESNYQADTCSYVQEAYQQKKWAFVSDYARFDILYNHGGIYLDTDVELIRSIDDILERGPFMGTERVSAKREKMAVAPGLGMAMPAGDPFCKEMLEKYHGIHFLDQDGYCNQITIVEYTTVLLERYGLKKSDNIQNIAGIDIYPWEYFCPMEFKTGKIDITANTRSIHHYAASWFTPEEQAELQFTICMSKCFGSRAGRILGRIYSFPYRIRMKIKKLGFWGAVKFSIMKVQKYFLQ